MTTTTTPALKISFSELADFVSAHKGILVGPAINSHKRTKAFHFVFKPTLNRLCLKGLNSDLVKRVINTFYPKVPVSSLKPYEAVLEVQDGDHSFRVHLFDGNLQYRLDKEFYLPSFSSLSTDLKLGFFFGIPLPYSESSSALFTKTFK